MFSGIIAYTQKAHTFVKKDGSIRLSLKVPKKWRVKKGDSIAIDGICATVDSVENSIISVFLMPETVRKTHLSYLSKNHVFNLEQPLNLQSLIGGHLVQGHIDTTASVSKIKQEKDSHTITFHLDSKFTKYIIYKGSISVNGVSLTVVKNNSHSFSVSLISYTLSHTNLGELHVGDVANIEVDMIAKYIEQLQKK